MWKLYCLFGLVFVDTLPFECPNKTPEGSPQPSVTGEEGGGLLPTLYEDGTLDRNTSEVYSEYRAAVALVPCDARPISVFTNPLVSGEYTVSVIYVYEKPIQDLKDWLRYYFSGLG